MHLPRVIAYCVTSERLYLFSVPYEIYFKPNVRCPVGNIVLQSVSKNYIVHAEVHTFLLQGRVRMRHPSATMSELDATMVKWPTGSIGKDGKKKRREE